MIVNNLLPERLRQKTEKIRVNSVGTDNVDCLLLVAVIAMPVWFEYQTVNALQLKADAPGKGCQKG